MATMPTRGATSRSVLPLRSRDSQARDGNGSHAFDSTDGNSPDLPVGEAVWHRSTPSGITRADSWGTDSPGWNEWRAHLAKRAVLSSVARLFPGKGSSLAWGPPAFTVAPLSTRLPSTADLVAALDRLERGKSWSLSGTPLELALAWMAETSRRQAALFGLECVAWARALSALAVELPGDAWWQILDSLLHAADSAGAAQDTLARQWLGTELPLSLAYVLPELKPARQLARCGGQELSTALRTIIAADGMPSARLMDLVPALWATWARSRSLARDLKKAGWNAETEERYTSFVRQMLRLARRDGTLAFSTATADRNHRDFLATACQGLARPESALAVALMQGREVAGNVSAKSLPAPAANNESAGISVLRPNWSRGRERVVVARSGATTRLELAIARDALWSGIWTCEVRRNGELLVPDADAEWDEVCWTSTEDADYLELEIALPQGIRVQRQIVLAREDRFLFLADAVLGTETAALQYRGTLPLGADTSFDPSTETREGYLVGGKPRGLVFPLALREWRAEPSAGELEAVSEQSLELRASRHEARCLYAPLFIDLHPRRMFRPATWRQLTIAENRQILSPDLAVGYRVQIRDEHWLVYRSLGPRGNRTLLGHNLVSEFLVARFKTDGEIEPLVEIE
jgi:hypothetical protein